MVGEEGMDLRKISERQPPRTTSWCNEDTVSSLKSKEIDCLLICSRKYGKKFTKGEGGMMTDLV